MAGFFCDFFVLNFFPVTQRADTEDGKQRCHSQCDQPAREPGSNGCAKQHSQKIKDGEGANGTEDYRQAAMASGQGHADELAFIAEFGQHNQ